ncbi:MAG TPA: SURF1 family protein [Beijerinckiaceae bacterium]
MTAAAAPPLARRLRGLVAPTLAAGVALAILLSLGFWQLRRLACKEAIVARIETRVNGAPRPLPDPATWADLKPEDYEYARVRTRGVFEHAREAFVFHAAGARTREPGWLVLTPLRLPGGERVIVNRGFVPLALRDPQARAQGQVEGETEVTGLLRAPERRNPFTPDDDPQKRVFHARDAVAIAGADGYAAAPFTIDADAAPNPGGWPLGGTTTLSIPNNHLSYAMTWFGLAATLLGVYGVFAWRRLRGEA